MHSCMHVFVCCIRYPNILAYMDAMFFDWLSIEQDFGYQLPIISDVAYQRIHLESGEASALSQPTFQHRGSFCDVVSISIRGSVLKMTGNPSRWGRLDNLFGLPTVDACVMVFKALLNKSNFC